MPSRTTEEADVLLQVKDLLADNPPPEGEDILLTKAFQHPNVNCNLVQLQGQLKPHYHESHDEVIYVMSGQGQQLVKGEWTEVTPGMVMFFPAKSVHATRPDPDNPLVFLSLFVPGMEEIDRVFVE